MTVGDVALYTSLYGTRFAVQSSDAFAKAIGTGFKRGVFHKDIGVVNMPSGAPTLRELHIEAPGTYAHTVNVANLAEAASSTIGANGLLARVSEVKSTLV